MEDFNNSEFNQVGFRFASKKRFELQVALAKMIGFRATHRLYNSIRERYGFDEAGELFKIGFTMLRYGILYEKGVGADTGMKNGVRFATARNKLGIIRRKQNPWISTVLSDEAIDELFDQMVAARGNTELKRYYNAIFDKLEV